MAGQKLIVAKKVKNGVLYTNGMIRVDRVIASYPHILEAYAGEDGGEPKFSIQGIANKDTHSEIIGLVRDELKRIMDDKKVKVPAGKCFMKDGDKWMEEKEECANSYVFTAREKIQPVIRDERARILDPEKDKNTISKLFYGGAVVSILINPWFQDNKFGKRINANFKAVLFVEDGEAFGEGRVSDDDAWGDVDPGDDDDTWDEDGGDADDDI